MILPCGESATVGALEARLVPGDGQLTVDWTAPSGDGVAVDDYDVRYRADAESGAWTELPDGTEGTATGATITGLTNGTAYQVQVRAGDGEWSATATGTPAAPAGRLTFGDAGIDDQRYRQYAAIAPLVLPAATGGEGPLSHGLSPALPAGLLFDAATRTFSGVPSVATAASTCTYTATDAGASPWRDAEAPVRDALVNAGIAVAAGHQSQLRGSRPVPGSWLQFDRVSTSVSPALPGALIPVANPDIVCLELSAAADTLSARYPGPERQQEDTA